ncbi:putative mediator of RNA polymerase II transcription subunit 29 isoform X2 [Rhopalosiphum maidis]|uniref:putative mediator of RNA polymerase II transcription subunit 29 isoform X2 n=1 Tax=Rhopalosiphum maidis TaxID=43146 RepID=UPI000EFE40DE|nr:putative mediator of RNA polymerase II transcription subunit 29 isoform X2 [Rhopalosiphum maidis]
MNNDIYKCRLCDRMYHDKEVVIDLSSEEAKKEQITSKILSALSIIITDHDPTPKYICRVCYGQVEVNFRFATTCRINNAKHMEKLMNVPSNDMLRKEQIQFMRIPIHVLFNKYQFDMKGLFDAVTKYLNDTNEDPSSTRHFENFDNYFGLNNHSGITNNIENDNPVGNGIPESSSVLDVIEPNINANQLNHAAETSTNKNVQFNKNFPINSRNNVNKTSQFRVLSRPISILRNGQIAGTKNISQNNGIAACQTQSAVNSFAMHKNQSTMNSPAIVRNTINNHSYSLLSKENGTTNDDDVICLDDDDDDDVIINDNNNNDGSQAFQDNRIPRNMWVNSSNVQANTNNKKTYQRIDKNNPRTNLITYNRKLMPIPENVQTENTEHSSSISCEEMMITPDLDFSTSNLGSSLNGEDEDFEEVPSQENNEIIESSLVIPETEPSTDLPPGAGIHFLCTSNDNDKVELTKKKEDNTEKKKPSVRKRRNLNTKKAVPPKKQSQQSSTVQHYQKAKNQIPTPSTSTQTTERSNTSLTKPRPKRASAIAATFEKKNSGLWKLGKHIDGYWAPDTERISLPLFRCPICDVIYWSIESRQRHEMSAHSSLLNSINKSVVNSAPSAGNAACTQQLHLMNYLQLRLVNNDEPDAINHLAKRTHLLKALKIIGPKTSGFFKCNSCPYETNLMFALWAHMSSNHLKSDFEKKSCLFCFLCNRSVSKRTTLLKHVDKCSKETLVVDNSCNQFVCTLCNLTFDSLIKLEDHTWRHK